MGQGSGPPAERIFEELTKEYAKSVGVRAITEEMHKRRALALKRRIDDFTDALADAREDQARATDEKAP